VKPCKSITDGIEQIMTGLDSHLLLRAFCDELARCGVQHACTSPGSRNTPLLLALAREPRIRCWSHIDERCAGFFAVGAAKVGGRPVALTCTSGTAAANFAPAVIEAWHARVPLIVLTADRPPDLRDNGAGQAIDQLKLYGGAVKWFVEVGVDRASEANLRWIRQLACRAYWTAADGRPGPVHLNFPLREPLVPDRPLPADPVPGRPDGGPWVRRAPIRNVPAEPRALPGRGVVIAGREERDPELAGVAARFAAFAGYPLLADPLSGARRGAAAIATYDLLLRDPELIAGLRPELIIRIGDLPTSKPLRAWLESLSGTPQLVLDPERTWQDPTAVLTELSDADPAAALSAWMPEAPADPSWLAAWREADQAVSAAIDETLGEELTEPLVARRLGRWLPPDATLFVASSMAVRDIEEFSPAGGQLPRLYSNRGANGIDGTISSAYGAAAAGGRRVTLLIGDVAFVHDVGGLMAATRLGLPLTVIVLNNQGGGIFDFLPVAGETDVLDAHIATAHELSFDHAAALFGCGYEHPATEAELERALAASLRSEGTTIIEVPSDRRANRELHRRVAEAALAARSARAAAGVNRPAGATAPGA
jgi:2-succinyl-5-enolpyruvyl-6-hydroxy-3-cyclohexene-1-carboxylate synthase